jgi:LDH2 family malate/lactate/ureidoglycolate dehydrogenase
MRVKTADLMDRFEQQIQVVDPVFVSYGGADIFCGKALVKASPRGVYSHGVVRLPMYCERLRRKLANPRPEIKVTRVAEAVAQVDGDNRLELVVGN